MRAWLGRIIGVFAPVLVLGQVDSLTPQREDSQTKADVILHNRAVNAFYNEVYRFDADLSWVTPPFFEQGGPRSYVLTADINPNFFLLASKRYRASVVITPRVKVRIMTGPSFPVRTPSFMPGGTFFYRLGRDRRFRYVTGSFFHHSNGQDGDAVLPNGQFNTRDGNFSTNFFEAAYHWGDWRAGEFPLLRVKAGNEAQIQERLQSYKVGLVAHVGSDEALRSTQAYGFVRARFRANYIWLGRYAVRYENQGPILDQFQIEKHRLMFQAEYIVGTIRARSLLDVGRRLNVELRYAYRFRSQFSNGFWFAAVGYYGQDTYNIYFQEHYPFVRVGIAFGPSVLLTSEGRARSTSIGRQ